jgi:hypothetical protein
MTKLDQQLRGLFDAEFQIDTAAKQKDGSASDTARECGDSRG